MYFSVKLNFRIKYDPNHPFTRQSFNGPSLHIWQENENFE